MHEGVGAEGPVGCVEVAEVGRDLRRPLARHRRRFWRAVYCAAHEPRPTLASDDSPRRCPRPSPPRPPPPANARLAIVLGGAASARQPRLDAEAFATERDIAVQSPNSLLRAFSL